MSKRALIVEDDRTTASRHRALMESFGYTVSLAEDGIAAMNVLREHPDITLALVDWYMQPLNGFAFTAAMRAERRYDNLVIIMVTSEDRPEKISQALQAGIDAHLVKPLNASRLLQTIEQVESERLDTPKTASAPLHGAVIDPLVGKREVIGEYRIGKMLGQGASSKVYLGTHVTSNEQVAIKILYSSSMDDRAKRRFRKEADLQMSLKHPNLLKAIDHGTIDDAEYLIMEFAPEGDLSGVLAKQGGKLDESYANRLIGECAQALAMVHQHGAAHRDIKPSNIFIGNDGSARLADFGLALTNLNHTRITGTGMTVGTPSYMAPEQVRGNRDDAQRSDIYGLGATWYHLVSGRPPFDEPTAYGTFVAIEKDPVIPPTKFVAELSEPTVAVIMQCLEKDPKMRPADAGTLADLIAQIT